MELDLHVVRAPGRVNLIGDHTDYTGGLVLPLAIDRWTEIRYRREGETIELTSRDDAEPAAVALDVDDPAKVEPAWARYVAGVVAEVRPSTGMRGEVSTTIPIGAGLSSSAALEVACALALGARGNARAIAELCRRAEHRATGVPTGILDQLAIAGGRAGHALLIDCHVLVIEPVPMPADVDVVVRFVAHRTLVGSAYADRVAECRAAERQIGPLRLASVGDLRAIADPVVRARARHVITENQRVRDTVAALRAGDLDRVGELMHTGHCSLRDDYATSTPAMDAAVATLMATPGVFGARMTGGGFGGCVIALAETGAVADGWTVRAVGGAHHVDA